MSILKRYGIKRTPENIGAVERAVRLVPVREPKVPQVVYDRLELLGKALINADLAIEDVLPVRFIDSDVTWPPAEPLPLAAVEALHSFYCEQTGTPDAAMSRNGGKRNPERRRGDAPALRFVTECLQTRNPKITVSAVEKAWRGRKSKAKTAV